MISLSTSFTLMRIILVPFIVAAMVLHRWGLAAGLFVIAALSDVADGKVARMLKETTTFGSALDPIADKILLLSTYSTLSFIDSPLFAIPHWFVYLVLAKELLQIAGAAALLFLKHKPTIAPTMLGKMTTVVQVCFIIWLFMCYFMHWLPVKTYHFMLSLVLVLVVATFIQYAKIGYKLFLR